jgi:hypothetical protein
MDQESPCTWVDTPGLDLDGVACGIAAAMRPNGGTVALAGAVIGLPVGALVGAATAPERWRDVPWEARGLDPSAKLSVAPRPNGAQIALHLSF